MASDVSSRWCWARPGLLLELTGWPAVGAEGMGRPCPRKAKPAHARKAQLAEGKPAKGLAHKKLGITQAERGVEDKASRMGQQEITTGTSVAGDIISELNIFN